MQQIESLDQLNLIIAQEAAVLVYFSHAQCGVCTVLKPKLSQALLGRFPKLVQCYVDVQLKPEVAGQFSIFAVPAVLVFFDGRKSHQYSRNMSVDAVCDEIARPYGMLIS